MYSFCTSFDRNYLPRGLALYRSLREHCPGFRLWVLCLDSATHEALTRLALPEVEPIALQDFESGDAPLLEAKANRSRVEYYFTCTASLVLYVLDHWPALDLVTYLDADLFFFASPAPLFEELGSGSVAIIGHRFSPGLRHREVYGVYNVGWVSFRRDAQARECLEWWRAQCLAWCYDRVEGGRFADQRYLDDWPTRFRNVVVLQHRGANLAPWNVGNHRLRSPDGGAVLVDGEPLIFFHFHALRQVTRWLYDPRWAAYGVRPSGVLRRRIYRPYLAALRAAERTTAQAADTALPAHGIRAAMGAAAIPNSRIGRAGAWLGGLLRAVRGLLTGTYIATLRPGRPLRPVSQAPAASAPVQGERGKR